jgi:hypothetical protein
LEILKLVIVWFLVLDQLIIAVRGWASLRDSDSELSGLAWFIVALSAGAAIRQADTGRRALRFHEI